LLSLIIFGFRLFILRQLHRPCGSDTPARPVCRIHEWGGHSCPRPF